MSLFQQSVLRQYTGHFNKDDLSNKYQLFKNHFHNPEIQENILNAKEEEYQEGFVRDLFVNVLGYTLNPQPNYNFVLEKKTEADSTKSDGAILVDGKVVGVLELKDTYTTELGKVEKQAFGYKHRHPNCIYVITSNFQKLRFYINDAVEFIEFNLFTLTEEEFELLFCCLECQNILKGIPALIKESSLSQEASITKKLYADYSQFKRDLFNNIVAQNPQYNKLELFKKTQKLLDRFLFILFAEDRLLVPPNSVREIIKQWETLKELDSYEPLLNRFRKYFEYLNTGHEGKHHEIFAYNGGLFAPDEILDSITIDDKILFTGTKKLSDYDFESEVDVNILGHIFEHSLTEIEEVQAELEGTAVEKTKTKRKKDGVFYTPRYITKYIVENTVGELCRQKKEELNITDDEFAYRKRKDARETKLKKLDDYRTWLFQLTICDPACGSGAFLNQALDFLIAEHGYIDELRAKLFGDAMALSDVETTILENNLFGVDINDEAIEIARLSLWLRTAQKGRKLNDLSKNIKCGNSLIDDPAVAGDKAFNWQQEFKSIFENGGFDIVIGNPPYTYRNAINEEEKKYFKETFNSTEGNFDLYKFFIEKIDSLTRNGSLSSFIVPNTFLSAHTYRKLREILITEFEIKEFFDLGLSIFENVVVESVMFLISKTKNSTDGTRIKIQRDRNRYFLDFEEDYKINLNKYYNTDGTFNIYLSNIHEGIIDRCKLDSIDLGKICYCTVGINTGYIKEEMTSLRKVDSRYHRMLNGKDIGRNFVDWNGEWIMYDSEFVKSKGERGRALPPEYVFTETKILVQRTRRGMKRKLVCYFDSEQYYNLNRLSNIVLKENRYNLKYIYCLLNSELLDYFFNKYFNEYEVKPLHLAKLPIKDIENTQQLPFIQKADIMLSKNKELQLAKQHLLQLLQAKYESIAFSKKLQDWPTLTFNNFLKELTKQKIKLSLAEQTEWMQHFETEKAKANAIQEVINTTDKEIDQMVYTLYGLTKEEIEIVEGL
ncbi:MAG TPA: N-6 DNA methylase [Bacteroidia bacterium]|nr:N-6 DNA methylase [Bacteroidia bacterium]